MYETLIRGATIIDGSGAPAFAADVAIVNERISLHLAGSNIHAHTEIDAEGLFLAPGFIDVHTHDDTHVIKAPEMRAKITQGVTTVIVGNCGISASPVTPCGRSSISSAMQLSRPWMRAIPSARCCSASGKKSSRATP